MVSDDELRRLALVATPGEWTVCERGGGHYGYDVDPLESGLRGMVERREDAAYIAAVNPTRVLALLDEREALRAALTGLLQVAWHDDDCTRVAEAGPCDCGFDEAHATAERVLYPKEMTNGAR